MQSTLSEPLVDDVCRAGGLTRPIEITRLSGGRTNAVWKVADYRKTVTLKIYARDRRNDLFPNDPRAERICLRHLAGSGLAPQFIASGTSDIGDWALFSFVEGTTWSHQTGQVGAHLRVLHAQSKPSGLRLAPNGSDELASQTLRLLSLCKGERTDALRIQQPKTATVAPAQTVLIHGDPVPGNLLVAGDKLCFIDWQCPGIGDAASDLAIFLSPAMQHLYRGAPLTPQEETDCLSAYGVPVVVERYHQLRPWFHWCMAAYCLWRVDQGEVAYARGFELERDALLNLPA